MFKKTACTVTIAGLMVAGFSATPAFAVDNTTQAATAITSASLANLGLTNLDPALTALVSTAISNAIAAGAIDPALIANPPVAPVTAPSVAPDPNATPTVDPNVDPSAAPVVDPSLAPDPSVTPDPNATAPAPPVEHNAELEEHLHEQEANWDLVKADWLAAFDTVKSDYQTCLDAGTPSDQCSANLGFKLQMAHGAVMLNNFNQRIADVAALPADQQADALKRLEDQRQRTLNRLAEAQTMLQDHIANGTPLPQGVKIKDIPGEADLVNGLLEQLGSPERAIPREAEHVVRNADGTVTVVDHDGEERTFNPEVRPAPRTDRPRPVETHSTETDDEDTQPAPQATQQGGTSVAPVAPAERPRPVETRAPEVRNPEGQQPPAPRPVETRNSGSHTDSTPTPTDQERD